MEFKQYEFILSHYPRDAIEYNNSRVMKELELKFRPIRASLFITCNSICQWKNLKDFESITKKKFQLFSSITCEPDFGDAIFNFTEDATEEDNKEDLEEYYSSSSSHGSPIGSKNWKRYEQKMLHNSFTSQDSDAWVVVEKSSPTQTKKAF